LNIVFYHISETCPDYAQYFLGSVRKFMPSAKVTHLTDMTTPSIPGVDEEKRSVSQFKKCLDTVSYTGYELLAKFVKDEAIFVDPDMVFNADVSNIMDGDFDVALASRPSKESMRPWYRRKYPYNSLMFVKNPEFWKDCFRRLLSNRVPRWIDNMIAVASAINSGKYKVHKLDGNIYNGYPRSFDDFDSRVKVFHCKGGSRPFIGNIYERVCLT